MKLNACVIQPDEVCFKLSQLIISKKISKDGILYQKKIVELIGEITVDLQYIEEHPLPSPDFIKDNLVTSVPVGVEYVEPKGKTGEEMQTKFLSHATLAQVCLGYRAWRNMDSH